MTRLPLVPVEGTLARPRVAPLDGVPPFGREWRPGAAPDRRCVATLTTSCIDVDAPHRTCRWESLPAARPQPPAARVPAIAKSATGRPVARAVGRAHDRRVRHAACWSIGALSIIGALIVAHEPFPDFASAPVMQTAAVAPEHATQFTGTVRVAAVEPARSPLAPAQHLEARPVATPAAPKPASRRPGTSRDEPRVATAAPSSSYRPDGQRTTTAQVHAPPAPQLAARPSITHHASHTPTRDRAGSPSQPGAPNEPLDDPLTLIAMANALRADRPARAAAAPAADFDWTVQLSHRRLTDVPDSLR